LQLYSEQTTITPQRKKDMLSYIQQHSKPFIVEEVESLVIREILTLM
jgi:hypothetical protein